MIMSWMCRSSQLLHRDAPCLGALLQRKAVTLEAAFVAAILSAMCEPLDTRLCSQSAFASKVNRLLVKRMTVAQAWNEMTLSLVAGFFLTTFPTNMLKFPVFEVINRAMTFTSLSAGVSAVAF